MLNRILGKRTQTALLLLAAWLVFECWISWAAFCHRVYDENGYYQSAEENDCVFRGPILSIVHGFFRWWRHVFDDAESYIALFTAVLAVGTLALWWSTRRLWTVTKIAAEHIPKVERAYIFGGAGHPVINDVADATRLVVTINNYGKTPAFVGTVAIGTSPWAALDKFSTWKNYKWKGYALPAPSQFTSDVDCPYRAGEIVYGRIWYRDIFNKCHSAGFALVMHATEGLPAVPGHEEYWQEREENDLGPAEPGR
jgi:hypothetical protein